MTSQFCTPPQRPLIFEYVETTERNLLQKPAKLAEKPRFLPRFNHSQGKALRVIASQPGYTYIIEALSP
jgi:hypothetical protein